MRIAMACLIGLGLAAPPPAQAGLLAGAVHRPTIAVCFVGDAVTSQPDDVAFIVRHLRIYESHGHLRYVLMGADGRCPPPTETADGQMDVHEGDLRIGVPGSLDVDGVTPVTGLALGRGCADPGTTLWWANFPSNLDVPEYRACRMNAYLRDGMALNKILHEVGHSLGLPHEHNRTDVPLSDPMVRTCFDDVSYFGRGFSQGVGGITFVTPYDRDSVMHYEINHATDPTNVPPGSSCNLGNDNGTTGLSPYDQLTIRILYPHDAMVAEYTGTTVVPSGATALLRNLWGAEGALVANVVRDPLWTVSFEGRVVARQATADLSVVFADAGDYQLTYTYQDMLGRSYTNALVLRVVPPSDFLEGIAAPIAARGTLL